MNLYGSKIWYDTKSNDNKVAIKVPINSLKAFIDILENFNLNYYGYDNGKMCKISINRDDLETVKSLIGDKVANSMQIEDLTKSYTPPEKNVFGTIDYKYIAKKSKRYITGESELEQKAILRTAELLARQNIKFSGRAYDSKITLTLNDMDFGKATEVYTSVLSNLQKTLNKIEEDKLNKKYSPIKEVFRELGFSEEQIKAFDFVMSEFVAFENVEIYDYIAQLNPDYTLEQNADIFARLIDIYKNGGIDYLQPSEKLKKLFEIKETYDFDIQLRAYLSKHEYNDEQKRVIQDIANKEGSIIGVLTEIDESFKPKEIEELYALYRQATQSDKFDMTAINNFLDNHTKNQYASENESAPYDDAFFVDNQREVVTWIYHNPDSDAGGQFVTNEFSFEELLLASEFTSTPEEFFEYIGQSCKQYLSDAGTYYYEEALAEFNNAPTFTDCSAETIEKLVSVAKKDENLEFFGKWEFAAVLIDKFTNDHELRTIYTNNNKEVFRNEVKQKIDKFIDKLFSNEERIQGYSRSDVMQFVTEYKYSRYADKVQNEIEDAITSDIGALFQALENTKSKAEELDIPLVDKFVDGDFKQTQKDVLTEKDETDIPEDVVEKNAEHLQEKVNITSGNSTEREITQARQELTHEEVPENTIEPTVTNLWSDYHYFEEDNVKYSIYEFDRLMKLYDEDIVSLKEDFAVRGDYYPSYYTQFAIDLPNGKRIEEKRELGNGQGGLIDFLRSQGKYDDIIPILEGQIEKGKPKKRVKSANKFNQLELTIEERPSLAEEVSQTGEKQSTETALSPVQVEDYDKSEDKAVETKSSDKPKQTHGQIDSVPKINYRITDNHIGEGNKSERFKNNIAAIRTLKQIESENRLATAEEQEILAKYVGWGGLSECFNEHHISYNQLKHYLTDDEFKAARASTLTAFYTPPVVMQSMYKALGNMGFTNGEILEPSCGVGNFIGTLPEIMQDSNIHAVELDSISGRIAKQLYQTADIKITGFEKTRFNDGAFDVAVGNVPFGEIKVRDKQYDKYNWRIHNYFFAKSLDKVRTGGVVAFITSRYTLDSKSSSFREYLSERADLLGAIRLPNNTFSKAAGTQVVSDIIFLQKRDTPPEITPEWVQSAENENGFTINKYFIDNPDMILGNLTECSSAYGRPDITVKPIEGAELSEQLDKAIENIKGTIPERTEELNVSVEEERTAESSTVPENLRNFSFYVNSIDNKVYFKSNDDGFIWRKGIESETYTARAKAFIELRDCTRAILDSMVNNCSDEELHSLQSKLNTLYDSFYKKYGLLHSSYNKNMFHDDISYQLVASLESKFNEKSLLEKSDLFTKRTIKPPVLVTSVDTAQEALTVSLAEKGRVDLEFMSELYGNDKEFIINELKGKIFPVPELSDDENIVYQDSSEYLSGDIRQKIDNAKIAAESNPILYAGNIQALESVLPEPLKAGDIDVKLGAAWIDPIYYQQFMYEVFKTPHENRADKDTIWRRSPKIELSYSPTGNSYHIDNKSIDMSVFATKTYGTKSSRANAYFIFENLLNLRETKIYKTVQDTNGNEKRVVDIEKTKVAASKAEKIKQDFKEWVFKDPKRREHLVKKYNDMYNSIRPREYDGSGLTFPGMNAEITLRPHQKDAIAHALYGGNTLFAHSVGAGKTYEMIATAMESKRLGLCTKSLMIVPNHLTEQIGADFQKLYPNANVLIATKADFKKENRRYLVSKIATGDYDAVVIGHSQLGKIPLSKEKQSEYIQEEIDELVEAISEMKSTDERSFSIKDAEKRKDNLEKKLDDLKTKKDDIVTFEELGIDKIFVDEAHEFKNLFTPTKLNNVSGINHSASQKASDLYMKCRYLDEKTGNRGVTFATGTPISNSVTELYTMQKYLQHDLLKQKNLLHFDQWITLFGEQVTDHQIDPTGKKYKPKTRIAEYTNMPELMSMFKCTADIKTSEMMNLDVPECEMHVVNVEPTQLQQDLVNELSVRADSVESGKVEPAEDNFLKITGDGRKVGLDPRLIDPTLEDNPNTKLNQCVENVLKIHKETAEEKLTQLIFCDLGVPKGSAKTEKGTEDVDSISVAEQESFEDSGNFCIYDDIKQKLIDGGVPANEIAYIHDAKTDKAKSELFEKCRKGEVRVLLGSTPKMGTGTNIQDKLVALHDLDVPWRPADLEQRLGRMVRQGNKNEKVHLYRYVTKGTFDAYSYQTLENKQKYISQIYTNQNQRTCQDVDQQSLSYAEIKTLCTGDERLKELMVLDTEVSNLNAMKRDYTNTVYEMQDKITKFADMKSIYENTINGIEKDIEICSSLPRDSETGGCAFEINVGGTTYNDKTKAAKALEKICDNAMAEVSKGGTVNIGTMHGFPITLRFSPTTDELMATVSGSAKYSINFSTASQPTNIKRLCNVFDGLEQRLANKKSDLARFEVEVQEAEKIIATPFEREQELVDKTKRRNTLKNELQSEAASRADEKKEKNTYYFSLANLRKNAQKCKEENKSKDKKKEKKQGVGSNGDGSI